MQGSFVSLLKCVFYSGGVILRFGHMCFKGGGGEENSFRNLFAKYLLVMLVGNLKKLENVAKTATLG